MPARVLVVDDDVAIRAALVDALDDGTVEIAEAASAEEAIRVLDQEGAPDVVLTDIRMRGLDGLDLLRILRERAPASRVVMMTAYHDVGTAVRAMREGAADFLCKPFDLHTLRDVVGRLLHDDPAASRAATPGSRTATPGSSAAAPESTTAGTRRGTPTRAGVPEREILAGRYELGPEIGRGAMARVFRARDARHGRHVAVKVLRGEVAASIGSDRFLREIQIAARLHHPHILTLIDSGERNGVPYFVMPFVDGPSLRRRLETGEPMPLPRAAALLRDVADALAAAHALGIVHRDVKPENVLLSGPHAWVADFGVARALWDAAGAGSTSIGSAIGTPAYMAPEQGAGDGQVDRRADIYALGVLAYELLAGRPPFSDESTRALLAAHLVRPPPPLAEARREIPGGLEETVMTCLAKRPEDRWPDAGTVARRFGAFAVEAVR